MACPTCNHTMQNLGVQGQRIFWCPRCGTLRAYTGEDFCTAEQPFWLRRLAGVGPEALDPARATDAVPEMVALLTELVAAYWGDWKAEGLREHFRQSHPDHAAIRAERILARIRKEP